METAIKNLLCGEKLCLGFFTVDCNLILPIG